MPQTKHTPRRAALNPPWSRPCQLGFWMVHSSARGPCSAACRADDTADISAVNALGWKEQNQQFVSLQHSDNQHFLQQQATWPAAGGPSVRMLFRGRKRTATTDATGAPMSPSISPFPLQFAWLEKMKPRPLQPQGGKSNADAVDSKRWWTSLINSCFAKIKSHVGRDTRCWIKWSKIKVNVYVACITASKRR